ncbi:hypothetical protein HQ571_06425 [Candidatus Kuenenbacteria bacterium]|nr:hypothetical protein [Candidatus Kuenenbacteria bacterium]
MFKKLSTLIFVLFVSISLTACTTEQMTQEKGTTFSKAGIRFDCPGGWEITEDKQVLENEYFVVCEKKGTNESGLVLVKWTTESLEKLKMLNIIKDYYKDTYQKKHDVEIKFKKVDEKKTRVEYSFEVSDVKHKGWITAKDCDNATAGLIFQSTKDDMGKDEDTFENIEGSFACN